MKRAAFADSPSSASAGAVSTMSLYPTSAAIELLSRLESLLSGRIPAVAASIADHLTSWADVFLSWILVSRIRLVAGAKLGHIFLF